MKWRARSLLLPKPHSAEKPFYRKDYGRIGVAGLFRTASGIGEAARSCFRGLQSTGFDVVAIDLSARFDQVDMQFDEAISCDQRAECDTAVIFLNAPELEVALFEIRHAFRARFNKRPYLIGAWAWELNSFPKGWSDPAKLLSELWVPSNFVRNAFSEHLHLPIKVVPHYVESAGERLTRQPSDAKIHPFRCLIMADGRSSAERKNIEGGIHAFQRAFGNDSNCQLIVKTRNFSEYQATWKALSQYADRDSRIEFIDSSLPRSDVRELIASCNVLISLHRAEGFGLHLAEAMAIGIPVIATAWSGNLEFMNQENAYLVAYELIDVPSTDPVYGGNENAVWADPDLDLAAQYLKSIRRGDPEVLAKRTAAIESVQNTLNCRVYQSALAGSAAHQLS